MARTWWAHPQQETPPEPRDAADWLRANGVTLTAVILIVIQLWWKAALLAHSYFRQDDYHYLVRAVHSGFSWKYLMWVDAGHMLPAGFAINWVLVRVSLYNWPLTSAVIVLMLAAASFAMLAMLRTVFGNRPAILIPLTLFLFSPLSLAAVGWWSYALEMLPLELAMCMAIRAHVHYLRDSRLRHALAATGWLILGMAATVKGAVVPLLLLGLTAAFFVTRTGGAVRQPQPPGDARPGFAGTWLWRLRSVRLPRTLSRYWRAWLLYGVVLAAYCAIYFTQLATSSTQPGTPTSPGQLAGFAGTLLGSTLLTGAVGGPWHWWTVGYAQAGPPAGLQQLSWFIAIVVVVVSCIYRARAWRAWAILLGWLVVADLLPVALGRLGTEPGSLLGLQTRYLTDALPVLALCVGLAFLPVVGEQHAYRLRFRAAAPAGVAADAGAAADTGAGAAADTAGAGTAPAGAVSPARPPAGPAGPPPGPPAAARWGRIAAILVLGAFLVGSFVSLQALESVTKPAAARDYIETAQIAVAHAPVGTLIVDGPVPADRHGPGLLLAAGVHVPGHRRDRARRAGPAPVLDQLAARGDPQPDDLRPAGSADSGHGGRAVVPAAAPAPPAAPAGREAHPRPAPDRAGAGEPLLDGDGRRDPRPAERLAVPMAVDHPAGLLRASHRGRGQLRCGLAHGDPPRGPPFRVRAHRGFGGCHRHPPAERRARRLRHERHRGLASAGRDGPGHPPDTGVRLSRARRAAPAAPDPRRPGPAGRRG